jgi:uncharacterized protein
MKREAADGSRLCLACGLCCQGLLHDHARLDASEVELARGLGLCTSDSPQGPLFDLPCPHHQGGRCTVYEERPSPCRDYRCKLLRRYLAGEVTWEEGIRRVEQARRLTTEIRRRIGAPESGASVWQQLRACPAATAADPELRMDVAALLALCQRHFHDRAEPRNVLGA